MSVSYEGTNFAGRQVGKYGFADLFTRGESDDIVKSILACYGASGGFAVDTSLSLWECYQRLPALDPATSNYFVLAAHALFQKNGDMVAPITDPEEVAWTSFEASERACEDTNVRFANNEFTGTAGEILFHAAHAISGWLGNCPELSDLGFRFGPGANVSDAGDKYTTPNVKLSGTVTCSNALMPHLAKLRALFPHLNPFGPVCGRLAFVPKNFKTHRSIMIEPTMNSALQLGLGAVLKRKLARANNPLNDQSIQQMRAREGSLTGRWATIDLSRASDSIAYLLVMNLVPWDWFELMDSLRTPFCTYKGKFIQLEKFSSMGNGFTFELETLIFKGLIRGIATTLGLEDDSFVYGDDITCNTELARAVTEWFPTFGFCINVEKSFLDGPFREACGGDYRNGVDIRPWFLRSNRDGGRLSYQKLFSLHNFLQRKPWFDPDRSIRTGIVAFIPREVALWGPPGYGDGHLVSMADLGTYLRRPAGRESQYEGFRFRTHSVCPHRVPQKVHSALPSYSVYRRLSCDDLYNYDVTRYPKDKRLETTTTWVTTGRAYVPLYDWDGSLSCDELADAALLEEADTLQCELSR